MDKPISIEAMDPVIIRLSGGRINDGLNGAVCRL